MGRLAYYLMPAGGQIQFALRFCLAYALALYLAMWLELDRPYWSALEVGVMMQPLPGMAVVRALSRSLGTIVAVCAGLFIMALFAQYNELSIVALAIWVAICCFFANTLRNDLSYGFAIAGFLAGVVVMISHTSDKPPFDVAVARAQECILAAMVVALVNMLLALPGSARRYTASRLALLKNLGADLMRLAHLAPEHALDKPGADGSDQASLDNQELDPHFALQNLAAQAAQLDKWRHFMRYESPTLNNLHRMARRLDYDLLAFISAISSLQIYLLNRDPQTDTTPLAPLVRPARLLVASPEQDEAIKKAFDQAHSQITASLKRPAAHGRKRTLADWVIAHRALGLASRGRAIAVTHSLLLRERTRPTRPTRMRSEFSYSVDIKNALRNSARSLVAVLFAGSIWVNFHDQLPPVMMVILSAGLTSIFSALPINPLFAVGGFARGIAVASIAAFIIDFMVMPQISSYGMLMITVLPFVFVAGLGIAAPDRTIMLPSKISVIMFSVMVHLQNGQTIDFLTYSQILMGLSSAVIIVILSFRLVFYISPQRRLREQMAGVFREIARGMRQSREQFETRMYDRLNSLEANYLEGRQGMDARQAVHATINIGLESRSLQVLSERIDFPEELEQKISREFKELQELFSQVARLSMLEETRTRCQAMHQLGQEVLAYAMTLDSQTQAHLVTRAAVCAELTASALSDYIASFEPEQATRADQSHPA